MGTDHRQELGRAGEEAAARHFERLGYEILGRRHRTRFGEIDLIVLRERKIVFVEVKTRRAGGCSPLEAIRSAKRRQVRRMASAWLAEERDRPYGLVVRFDAVGVTMDRAGALVSLDHIEAAF